MWQSALRWVSKLVDLDSDSPQSRGGSPLQYDDTDDDDFSTNPDEVRVAVSAELTRIEHRIAESEEALHSCQAKITALPGKVQTLFEALEALLMDSYDADAATCSPPPSEGSGGTAKEARPLDIPHREARHEAARQAARHDVMASVRKLLAHRDQLEKNLVRLQVSLRALQMQRDRVTEMLSTQTEATVLERGSLMPVRPPAANMTLELEVRDTDGKP